jgi:putative MATE family efflux protein
MGVNQSSHSLEMGNSPVAPQTGPSPNNNDNDDFGPESDAADVLELHRLSGNPVAVLFSPAAAGLSRDNVNLLDDQLGTADGVEVGSNIRWDTFLESTHRNDSHQSTVHHKKRSAPLDDADLLPASTFDPLHLVNVPDKLIEPLDAPVDEIPPLQLSRVLGFCIPALGAVLADPLMSLVDTACVGQVSSIGLAALGPNTSVFGFASMVFQFFTVATTAIVSRAHDRNDNAKKSQCVSDALSLAVVCGVAASTALHAFGGSILQTLYTPPELMAPALQYLKIRAFALPAALVTLVGTAASLGQRDSRTPLRVALATGTFNLVVDIFLVLGPPKLGIFGAAIATCGSHYLGAVVFLLHLSRGRLQLSPKFPSWARAKPFVSAGGVLTIRSVCVMSSYSLATAAAASMGTLTVAAHQVLVGVMTVAQFCPEPLSSCAQSNLASVATKHAKGTAHPYEAAHARQAARLLLRCGVALGGALAALCGFVLGFMPVLFSSDPAVVLAVSAMAPLLSVTVFVYTVVCVMDGLIFASGRMFFAAGTQVVNLPAVAAAIMLTTHAGFGLTGIWRSLLFLFAVRLVENGVMMWRDFGPCKNGPVRAGTPKGPSGMQPNNSIGPHAKAT